MLRFQRVANFARLQAGRLGHRQASGASNVVPPPGSQRAILRHRFVAGLSFGLSAGFLFEMYQRFKRRIAADSRPTLAEYVDPRPPTDAAPFPATLAINKVEYLLLGTGVRTVTFLNFHVYAAGMYIAVDDIPAACRIMSQSQVEGDDVQSWTNFLSDPVKGTNVLDGLLRANIRFAIRIVPVRNTGFGHLRDGFIKSVLKRPEAKALQSPEFGDGINELRRAFGRKKNLQKGEVIVWAREKTGVMTAWHGEGENKELLGSPADPDVSRLFFLQYLSGDKPSSPSLKEKSMVGLAALIASAK